MAIKDVITSLCFYQLDILIKRGQHVEEAKEEWKRRTNLEYPYIKGMSGVKVYEYH